MALSSFKSSSLQQLSTISHKSHPCGHSEDPLSNCFLWDSFRGMLISLCLRGLIGAYFRDAFFFLKEYAVNYRCASKTPSLSVWGVSLHRFTESSGGTGPVCN